MKACPIPSSRLGRSIENAGSKPLWMSPLNRVLANSGWPFIVTHVSDDFGLFSTVRPGRWGIAAASAR
ncbi:MAG: hypothetical protein ACREP8_13085 [Candidatus Binatia bacterium]